MKPYRLRIEAGAEEEIFVGDGDYVRIAESSVAITVDSPDRYERITLTEGEDAKLSRFERLRLSHAAPGDVEVLIYIGNGTHASSSRIGGEVAIRQGGALALTAAAVTDTAAPICPPLASRRALHVRNTGGAAVGLGPAGITTADAPILLEPGEEWREEAAAAAQWFAVTDSGQASTLAVLEVS